MKRQLRVIPELVVGVQDFFGFFIDDPLDLF